MGIFQSKEEKRAERRELKKIIRNSPLTQVIREGLKEEFGDLDGEKVQKLRMLSKENGIGCCILMVDCGGFHFDLKNGHGEIPHLTVWDNGVIVYNADRPKQAW